jgi:membrane protease YdiL (CAAX protease family)
MPNAEENQRDKWLRPELVASWREMAGVLLFLLAPFAGMSALAASRGSQTHYVQHFLSDRALLLNGAMEAAILGLGILYFHRRGWRPADLRIRPGVISSLEGFGLLPLGFMANTSVVFGLFVVLFLVQKNEPNFFRFVMEQSPQLLNLHVGRLSWSVIIGAMVLNAFLEEIVCTSYAFNQFAAKRGPVFALLLVVILRMSCHTYQGPVHMLGVGALFFVFGAWYWWRRNVWTLILVHALIDLSSLSFLKLLHP